MHDTLWRKSSDLPLLPAFFYVFMFLCLRCCQMSAVKKRLMNLINLGIYKEECSDAARSLRFKLVEFIQKGLWFCELMGKLVECIYFIFKDK